MIANGSMQPADRTQLPPDPNQMAEDVAKVLGGGPNIFTALEKQLGLKLEKGKRPVDFLVIDQADKVPTEN
ncbi:MAG TPA: TIGR03435 family protein [Bryobacteraceae bacterium]